MPLDALETRSIPLLRETVRFVADASGEARGDCAGASLTTTGAVHWRELRHEFALHGGEGLDHTSLKNSWTGVLGGVEEGKFQSVLLHFGKIRVGCPELRVEGATGGEVVDCCFYESLKPGLLSPDYDPRPDSHIALGLRIICVPGTNRHNFHHPMRARYVVLTLRGPAPAVHAKFAIREYLYPLARTGSFESSDRQLNDIWEICAHTQEGWSTAWGPKPHRAGSPMAWLPIAPRFWTKAKERGQPARPCARPARNSISDAGNPAPAGHAPVFAKSLQT